MIICDFDDSRFGLEFEYSRIDDRDTTVAILRTVPKTGRFYREQCPVFKHNSVTRDSRDSFVKANGRKAAIKKMLCGLPRAHRTAVWESYINRK